MLIHLEERIRFISPIVVVDEEAELVQALADILRKEYLSIPVIGHSTARQAAALIARERPSLLICNLDMPRVGGVDLITLSRKRWGNLLTVALVGMGLGWSNHPQVEGIDLYIEKAVVLGELCARIAELPGFPPRTAPSPPSEKVLVDVTQLTSGLEKSGELRTKNLLAHQANFLAAAATPGLHEPSRSRSETELTQQALFNRIEDHAWSSETPLPPHSTESFDDAADLPLQHDNFELSDAEIEIIEYQDEPRSADNDRSKDEEPIAMALTASNVKENLAKLEAIEGFVGAALADSDSGMCIGYLGGSGVINLEIAAAANTEVVRSKRKAVKALNLRDDIEDILITLGKQYHLIRPVRSRPNLFFYLVLDRQRSNLAMARYTLSDTERELPM